MIMQWYQQDNNFNKKRFLREVAFVEEFNKVSILPIQYGFSKGKFFVIDYVHEYKGKKYWVECFYPYVYPKVRIRVRIWHYSGENIEAFEQGYHNSEGEICYLNHYPNQWDEDYGIEYIMQRIAEWFESGQYDSNNILPINYDRDYELFILPENLSEINNECVGIFHYSKFQYNANIVTEITIDGKSIRPLCLPISLMAEKILNGKGIVVFTKKPIVTDPAIDSKQKVKTFMNIFSHGSKGFFDFAVKREVSYPIPLMLIYINDLYKGQVFLIDPKKSSTALGRFRHLRVYEDIFSRESNDQLNDLRNKKVAVIGLGALGSTITAELARSGVTQFLLVDNDKLEIENIGRHDLSIKDINKYKTDGVREKIMDINPQAECQVLTCNVLDDYSVTLSCLQSYDIIVSTIDDVEARYAINSTLIPINKKVIFAGVFYNAVAGFVLISEKKISCFECQARRIDKMAADEEIPDFAKLLPEEMNYGCGRPTFPGGSIKTHTVALLTAKIAVDTLLQTREFDSNGYPYNFYLIGNEKMVNGTEFFKGYMDVKKYILPGIKGCEVCDQHINLTSDEENKYIEIMDIQL